MAERVESLPLPLGREARPSALRELIGKEDWLAIWIGLGLVLAAIVMFAIGNSIKWLAIAP